MGLLTQHSAKFQSRPGSRPWTCPRFLECSAVQQVKSRTRLMPAMSIKHADMQIYPGSIIEASDISGPLASEKIVFYTHVLCPFAERVWLTLLEKQVEHELVHVDLSCKPAWYRGLNPRGLVPCVAYQNEIIIESEDICRLSPSTPIVCNNYNPPDKAGITVFCSHPLPQACTTYNTPHQVEVGVHRARCIQIGVLICTVLLHVAWSC